VTDASGPAAALPEGAPASRVIWLYEAQKKIYPRAVSGWFARWRWALVWVTQILFYGLPWLTWNGRQAVLFDLDARRFYIGGLVLYPQDFIYLTALLLISAYALFLFTTVAGRLWCGYACPQTVYTEVFLWIERKFEGDRMKRMKLDGGPWTLQRALRKGGKHLAWITLALWTGFTLVGYFTPIKTLAAEALTLDFGPWEWFWVLFYGLATYGNAGFLREQVCMYMCPYARFQSAMFDKDTLVIGYDKARGEPRGTRARKADLAQAKLGHCIDCELCVQVCPTGIDIRKGLQYECIGCAACIDVCNGVMDKMQYPRGLIRYDTQNGVEQQLTKAQVMRRVFRPRVMIYTAILAVVVAGVLTSLAQRTPFKVDVVRDRGAMARVLAQGRVENVYRLQIMNASEQPQRFRVAVQGLDDLQVVGLSDVRVDAAAARWVPVSVQLPASVAAAIGGGAHRMEFHITQLDASDQSRPAGVKEPSTFFIPR
jgi:cytochrome c oxidase accessory protein FixG